MTNKLYDLLHFGSFFLTKWLALRVGGRRFQSIKNFVPRRSGPRANRADVNQLPYLHKRHKNVSNREHLTLHSLASNRRIISKPADKGSSTVIMNTCDWIYEAMKQLSNTNFHKPGDQQIDKSIYDVTITLKIMRINKEIHKNYLPSYSLTRGIQDTFVCCQKFTKVLQVDISSQPFPREKILEFLDFCFLQPHLSSTSIPSYTKTWAISSDTKKPSRLSSGYVWCYITLHEHPPCWGWASCC